MSQSDYVIDNQTAPNFRADLNLALQALASTSSGATAPSTTYANMLWYDSGTNILKMRSEADDAWINLGTLDQSLNTFVPAGVAELTQVQVEDDTSTVFGQVSGERLGQAVAANAQGSITLLGTLTTTSGSSQVLSGLTLTPYKELHIVWSGVSPTLSSSNLRLQGDEITGIVGSGPSDTTSGFLILEFDYGSVIRGFKSRSGLSAYTAVTFLQGFSVSAATTSLTFDWATAANFDAGEIKVYGVR